MSDAAPPLVIDPPFVLKPGETVAVARRRDGTLVSATLEMPDGTAVPLEIRVRYLDEPRYEFVRPRDAPAAGGDDRSMPGG